MTNILIAFTKTVDSDYLGQAIKNKIGKYY